MKWFFGFISVDKLNACFTVLDAVGNSRTIMNTSTSNFTQITTANFDSAGQLTSVAIQVIISVIRNNTYTAATLLV